MDRPLILRGGRVQRPGVPHPERLDLKIDTSGRITEIGPSLPVVDATVMDLSGRLVTSGLVDIHQHLDKSRTRRAVANPSATLAGASSGYRAFAETVTRDDIVRRAEKTVDACSARGTVAIRSHTNIEPQTQLRGIEAMLEVRARCARRMTIQVVAHVTSEATSMFAEARDWLKAATAAGVDAVGGVPATSDRPIDFLKLLFEAAERSSLPLDLHLDEHLDPNNLLFEALIEMTRAFGMQGRVTAGHCSALSAVDAAQAARIAEGFAKTGIAVVTLPAANLFLQGRQTSHLPPRGLTRVRELIAASVDVAAASDNIRDPFVPTGSGDLLEIARWTLLAGHFGLDDLGKAFEMVSVIPARIMGLSDSWGIHEGARADLLITDAGDADDLVEGGALDRIVMVAGEIVAPQTRSDLPINRA
ncbi:MAG: amidohydrolase family protein [Methylobacteriaceae bacterium]|nr:amidohydrolase family protein [Methylobacteriaceae bacterium]